MAKPIVPLLLMLLLSMMVFSVYGEVISGSASDLLAYPTCTLNVAVDTNAHIISIYYTSAGYIITPFPMPYIDNPLFSGWHVWDGKGFDAWSPTDSPIPYSDAFDLGYTNDGTWLHSEMVWFFCLGVYGSYRAIAHVDLYIPDGDDGSGGGGSWLHPLGSPHL